MKYFSILKIILFTPFQELKQALAYERKKFELSDTGKSSQNNISNYEVANLIDDYKKVN